MNKQTNTQTTQGTWGGDTLVSTQLDRKGAITRIYATARVTPSATFTGANQPDSLFRVMKALVISGGSHQYFTLPSRDTCGGGILLRYLNHKDGFGSGHPLGGITAPKVTYTPVTFVLHAGTRPQASLVPGGPVVDNPYDLTAFIPAISEASVTADWSTAGNDVMDDTVTISSAVFVYSLCQVLADEQELLGEMLRQGVMGVLPPGAKAMIPAWAQEVYLHQAASSDYSTTRDLPPGGYLSRVVLLEQDATGTRALRASDEVTGVSITDTKRDVTLYKASADIQQAHWNPVSNLVADDGADIGNAAPDGVIVVDVRPNMDLPHLCEYGMNMTGVGTGELRLGLTITEYASGDHSMILYERRLAVGADRRIP